MGINSRSRGWTWVCMGALVLCLSACSSDEKTGGKTPTPDEVQKMRLSLHQPAENKVIYESPGFQAEVKTVPEPPKQPMPAVGMNISKVISKMSPATKEVMMKNPQARPLFMLGQSLIDRKLRPLVNVQTDKGAFVIQVDPNGVPTTAGNFISLASKHFYNNLTFHRYVPGFVIQGGDPQGTGQGGPGYSIPDEPTTLLHDTGAVAMAKSGPNTAGSQFYITLAPAHNLDTGYTVFGTVIRGMDVVQKLRAGDKMLKVTVSGLPKDLPTTDPMEHNTTAPPKAPPVS